MLSMTIHCRLINVMQKGKICRTGFSLPRGLVTMVLAASKSKFKNRISFNTVKYVKLVVLSFF